MGATAATKTARELADEREESGMVFDPDDAPEGWLRVRDIGPLTFAYTGTARDFGFEQPLRIEVVSSVPGYQSKHRPTVFERHFLDGQIVAYHVRSRPLGSVDANDAAWLIAESYSRSDFERVVHHEPHVPDEPTVDGEHPHSGFDVSRYERAMSESPFVERSDSPRLYEVESSSGSGSYEVDMVSGNCTCQDSKWNPGVVCKHAVIAVLAQFYSSHDLSRFAARVSAAVVREGCVFDHDECGGPTSSETLPCARCLGALDVSVRRGWDMTAGMKARVS